MIDTIGRQCDGGASTRRPAQAPPEHRRGVPARSAGNQKLRGVDDRPVMGTKGGEISMKKAVQRTVLRIGSALKIVRPLSIIHMWP